MKKIIDLSHNIINNLQVYPGDPKTRIREHCSFDKDGYMVNELSISTHCGTHIDAPNHFIKGGKGIDKYPISKFIGKGIVIDVHNKKDDETINLEDLQEYKSNICNVDFVIFKTGFSKYFNSEKYIHHPYLSKEVALNLIQNNIQICGIDAFSLDSTSNPSDWAAHDNLLKNDVLIVENLTNLDLLEDNKIYEFHFVPLNLHKLDASPIRAFAIED